jgi:hypothetical protein
MVLRLIPKQSKRRTKRLARFRPKERFWIFRVETSEIHGASVQRAMKGVRNNQTKFWREIIVEALKAITVPYTGIKVFARV